MDLPFIRFIKRHLARAVAVELSLDSIWLWIPRVVPSWLVRLTPFSILYPNINQYYCLIMINSHRQVHNNVRFHFTLGAIEKQKLVYILNRDAAARLTISSPLEAHKSHTLVYHVVGVDVGFENPMFACLEMDYEVCLLQILVKCSYAIPSCCL